MGYKDDLTINKHELDIEWMNQPRLFAEWGEKLVNAEEKVDKAKAQLELVRAQVDSKIRLENSSIKVTENFISNAIMQDKNYQKAIADHIEAKKQQGIIEIARKAFEFQRNKALDRLTDLFLSNYWAEPRGKAEGLINSKGENAHLETLKNNPRIIRRKQEVGND